MEFAYLNLRRLRVVFAALLLIGALAGIFLLFTLQRSPLSLVNTGQSDTQWAAKVSDFYNDASLKVLDEAIRTGVDFIQLGKERNQSRFFSTSPCNEGLAGAIVKRIGAMDALQKVPEVVFWKEPLYVSPLSRWMINYLFLKTTQGPLSRGWFRMYPDGRIESFQSTGEKSTLPVAIGINDIRINTRDGSFESEISLAAGTLQETNLYKGTTNQVLWFLRKKSPLWFLYVNALLLLLLIVFLIQSCRQSDPTVRIALTCCLIGQIYIFVLLLLSPVTREQLQFFRNQTRIFYTVDINSGIWFKPSGKDNVKAGPDYFARNLEKKIGERMVGKKQGELMSFWRWLWSPYSIETIYSPRRFELNRPCSLDTYMFSGHRQDQWRHAAISELAETKDSFARESRVVNPFIELMSARKPDSERLLQESHQDLALVLTSASASCDRDARKFVNTVTNPIGNNSDLRIFTILVPSVPVTGADRFYDFEDGKTALVSLVSDYVVSLNQRNYDDNELREILKNNGINLSDQARLPAQHIRLRSALYAIPNLSSKERDNWDVPRDLDAVRTKYLLVERHKIEETTEELISIIKNVLGGGSDNKDNLTSVHVIGRVPVLWLALIALASFLCGFFIFVEQYNSIFLREFKNRLSMRIGYYAAPGLSLACMILFIFAVVWHSQNPEVWTDFGDSRWALAAGLVCWLSWFMASFIYFKSRILKGEFRMGLSPGIAKSWAFSVCLMGLVVISIVFAYPLPANMRLWGVLCKFWLTLALVFSVVIGGFITPCGNKQVTEDPGTLEWWRHPWWSFFVKTLLLAGIVILFRGAFLATPAHGRGAYAAITGLISSYQRFVLAVAFFWAIIGFSVILAMPNEHRKWEYWIGPVITIIVSILLFLGG